MLELREEIRILVENRTTVKYEDLEINKRYIIRCLDSYTSHPDTPCIGVLTDDGSEYDQFTLGVTIDGKEWQVYLPEISEIPAKEKRIWQR